MMQSSIFIYLTNCLFPQNLGNLIKMPGGCGEQNMLGFAPNIYVLQYLEASDQINKVTREKLIRFMKSGECLF